MTKPVVGVIGNSSVINDRHNVQLVGQRNMRAVAEVAGALPLMFAGTPDITDVDALLGAVDGILLTGARANVHPTCFGVEPDPRHEPYDQERDAMALGLIRACVERGIPLFGICRGLQEMNVAFGGSLHPEIRDIPGRMNHRMPRLANGEIHPDPNVVFADRHEVRLAKDPPLRGDPGELAAWPGHRGARQARRRRGRGGGRHDRGNQHRRRTVVCARRPVARRIRPAEQSDQPGAVPGVRDSAAGTQALRALATSW
jgi:gamma-glutamyl-gamma-aminobutyrate hydrolase PuuD